MIDLSLLPSALGSIKAAAEIASSMAGMKTAAEVNAKAIELQGIIIQLQTNTATAYISQTALVDENRELKNELAKLKDTARDLERYTLLQPWPGSAVYALRYSMRTDEAAHYLCANCYQSRRKTILSCSTNAKGWACLKCIACTFEVTTEYQGLVEAQFAF